MLPLAIRPPFRTALFLVILLLPMVVRTTPPHITYFEFRVDGTLIRSGGGSPANYTVGLMYHNHYSPAGIYERLYEGDSPLWVTADTGSFRVVAQTVGLPDGPSPEDSLRLAVFIPGNDPLLGEPFAAGGQPYTPNYGYYTQGSDGCCEDPQTVEVLDGYTFFHTGVDITVP